MPSRSRFGSAADREEFPRLRSDIGEDDPLYHPKLGALFRKSLNASNRGRPTRRACMSSGSCRITTPDYS